MHIEADLKNTFFRARLVECGEIYAGVREFVMHFALFTFSVNAWGLSCRIFTKQDPSSSNIGLSPFFWSVFQKEAASFTLRSRLIFSLWIMFFISFTVCSSVLTKVWLCKGLHLKVTRVPSSLSGFSLELHSSGERTCSSEVVHLCELLLKVLDLLIGDTIGKNGFTRRPSPIIRHNAWPFPHAHADTLQPDIAPVSFQDMAQYNTTPAQAFFKASVFMV